ncbi:MAG: Ribosomal protein S3 [Parcubacteria group bacterium GW2011_GWC2_39_14]|nr:MAG: Ribosomal protein S3 [Parcubacteria group bacterium GW2011_GWC2_39_14]KKR55475.1 MAG: Ribosomal protein S3 [Parcubacteria group bacterium GW2011_GWA2_40_23]
MGKKINPKVFRLGQTRTWDSRWFSSKNFSNLLQQDILIKKFLNKKLEGAFVSRIEIERTAKEVNVIVTSARPGVIIGRGGVGVEDLKKEIKRQYLKDRKIAVNINIKEVENVNTDATIVGLGIKADIEKRIPFRRAMKQAINKVEKAGAKGVKVQISGRLNGVEIARSEKLLSGKVPLHTIRADVDYAQIEAFTLYGVIGIKVWIYRGDIFNVKKVETTKE